MRMSLFLVVGSAVTKKKNLVLFGVCLPKKELKKHKEKLIYHFFVNLLNQECKSKYPVRPVYICVSGCLKDLIFFSFLKNGISILLFFAERRKPPNKNGGWA